MPVITEFISVATQGNRDVIDLTSQVKSLILQHSVENAVVSVFSPGSTAAITTIEYEPGLKKDIDHYLNKLIPYDEHYYHHETWHDDNGSSHIQAAIIGPSETIPLIDGSLYMGKWQQIVLIDCDTRARTRKIVIQIAY